MRAFKILYLTFMITITLYLSTLMLQLRVIALNKPNPGVPIRSGEAFQLEIPLIRGEFVALNYMRGVRLDKVDFYDRSYVYHFTSISEKAVIEYSFYGLLRHDKVLELKFLPWVDNNGDLFPDVLVLDEKDSEIFRKWFVNIALSQSVNLSDAWIENERDCSGLIRFSTREALRKHDENWYLRTGFDRTAWFEKTGVDLKTLPDVNAYNYPELPALGYKIFMDENGEYGYFADAYNLLRNNVEFVSRDIEMAEPGDLLFFHHPSPSTFHTMLYVGDGLLYHTGRISEDDPGMIKLWPMSRYMSMMPYQWLPVESNSYFLGVYKFKFITK